jgi:large subunit ribosomal protein L10
MNRTEKQTAVDALAAKLQAASTIYVTDYAGLNVARVTELRRRLRRAGAEYLVVKNTLARRALAGAAGAAGRFGDLDAHFVGPTAVALTASDAAGTAKVLTEFAKEFAKPAVKAAVVEGRAATPEQVRRLALLPPREVLLAQVAGTLQAPLAGFLGALTGLLSTFVGAVEALRSQRDHAA